MSHPAELIARIGAIVQQDFDPAYFTFVYEKQIPGTRMLPDIQVINAKGAIVCAVEIGYTRPEKLSAYRNVHKIPDVRWYDKAGVLHADVQETISKVTFVYEPPPEVWVYTVDHVLPCESEECLAECHPDWYEGVSPETLIDPEDPAALDEFLISIRSDVRTWIITDRVRVFLPSFCDKCGSAWLVDPAELDADHIVNDLHYLTSREFGRQYGAAQKLPWELAVGWMRTELDIELDYAAGDFVDEEAIERHRRELSIKFR